jgi:hypothetical protein
MTPVSSCGLRIAFGPLSLLVLVLAAGCSHGNALTASHPALQAVDSNRDRLVGTLVVPHLDRTLATADALKADGLLPFGGAELRQMLLARLDLDPALLDLVDTQSPIAVAFVIPPGSAQAARETPPAMAGAIAIRSVEAAAKVLAAAGTAAETRKEAQRIALRGGKSLWIARVGTQIVWSDSFESLSEAGAHAALARQTPLPAVGTIGDDLSMMLYPPAMLGPGGGPDWKRRALSAYDTGLRDNRSAASERAAVDAGLDFFMAPMEETDRLHVALGLSAEHGLGAAWHATPRPGTAFAKRVAARAPYQMPAGLVRGAGAVALLSTGALPAWPGLVQTIIDRQAAAQVPGAAGVSAHLRPLLALLTGAVAIATHAAGDTLAVDWVVGLAPQTAPAAAVDGLSALVHDPSFALLMQQVWGRNPGRVDSRRQGTRLEVTFRFPDNSSDGSAGLARAFSGSNTLTVFAEAAPGRLVLSSEPGAADRVRTLLTGVATTAAPGEVGAATQATAGREALLYLDLWGFARPVLRASLGGSQRRMMDMILAIPGLSSMSLPLWVSLDGGDAFAVEVRVPVATLRNASTLLGLLGGAGAALPQLP